MERITAEQERQQRREAAVKLLRILESSPLDEALLLSCSMIAVILRSAKLTPESYRWNLFFRSFRLQVEDQLEPLDTAPSWQFH